MLHLDIGASVFEVSWPALAIIAAMATLAVWAVVRWRKVRRARASRAAAMENREAITGGVGPIVNNRIAGSAFHNAVLRARSRTEALHKETCALESDNRTDRDALFATSQSKVKFATGVLSLIAWLPTVCFGVVVLAPVIELFVGASGDPIHLPLGIGDIAPVALILSLILALVGVISSVAAAEGETKPVRGIGAALIVGYIVFAAWGGWLKGQLADNETGGTLLGLTFSHGPFVSAVLAALGPSAEAIASVLAFRGVLHAVLPNGGRALRVRRINRELMRIEKAFGSALGGAFVPPGLQEAEQSAIRIATDSKTIADEGRKSVKDANALLNGKSPGDLTLPACEVTDRLDEQNTYLTRAKANATQIAARVASETCAVQIPTGPITAANAASMLKQTERAQRELKLITDHIVTETETVETGIKRALSTLPLLDEPPAITISRLKEPIVNGEAKLKALVPNRLGVLMAARDILMGEVFEDLDKPSQDSAIKRTHAMLGILDGQPVPNSDDGAVLRRDEALSEIAMRLAEPPPPSFPPSAALAGLKDAECSIDAIGAALSIYDNVAVIDAQNELRHLRTATRRPLTDVKAAAHEVEQQLAWILKVAEKYARLSWFGRLLARPVEIPRVRYAGALIVPVSQAHGTYAADPTT